MESHAEPAEDAEQVEERQLLKYRVISGCAMGAALLLAAFWLPAVVLWMILAALGVLGQLEFYALVNRGGIPVYRVLGAISGVALGAATFFGSRLDAAGPTTLLLWQDTVLLITLLAVFVRQFPEKDNPKPLETIGCTLLGVFYVPYLLTFVIWLAFAWDFGGDLLAPMTQTGRLAVLYLIVVVKVADIGAYFVGMRFGRHKLFPRISPGKSWEGLAGGIGASVLASGGFYAATHGVLGPGFALTPVDAVALGVLLSLAGVVGDLFESLIKRATGAKDSSAAIPGMGGLLDVLDSLLFGAPVLYLYLFVFGRSLM